MKRDYFSMEQDGFYGAYGGFDLSEPPFFRLSQTTAAYRRLLP